MKALNGVPTIIPLPPNRVWRTYLGGKILDTLEKKEIPTDSHFPEDWIASTTRATNKGREDIIDEGVSRIKVGNQELFLKDLFIQYPEETLGTYHIRKYGFNTQFLLKLLDSSIRLHIQCHPTAEIAKKYLNTPSGKTEAYVILKTRDEVQHPYVYLGFQNPLKKETLKNAILEENIETILSCFEKIEVRAGDVFIVPGGLPHAIGEGILMVEIMEPTDFVVRIEFERGGYVLPEEARFMGRGVDFGLSLFNLDKISVDDVKKKYFLQAKRICQYNDLSMEYGLIDASVTNCFKVKKLCVNEDIEKKEDSFYIGIVSKGAGVISSQGLAYAVQFGDKFFIPIKTDSVRFQSRTGMEILIALPPD